MGLGKLRSPCVRCGEPVRSKPCQIQQGRRFCSPKCWYASRRESLPERFLERVSKSEGCWEYGGEKINTGYGSVRMDSGKRMLAHRYSWLIHFGEIPAAIKVLHRCDNKICVRPDHLFLGTLSDNTQDMIAKGRHYTPFAEPGFHARIH